MARAEPAPEQLLDVDLAAGGGQRQEVEIVDVDVAVLVREAVLGIENVHLVELLGAFAAVLQHRAHSGVAVDVGVLALEVVVLGVLEGQVADGGHEPGVHFPDLGALVAVQDVGLGGAGVSALDEGLFHQVLHLFDVGDAVLEFLVEAFQHFGGDLEGKDIVLPALTAGGAENRLRDLVHVKGDDPGVTFPDRSNHSSSHSLWDQGIRTCSLRNNFVKLLPKKSARFVYYTPSKGFLASGSAPVPASSFWNHLPPPFRRGRSRRTKKPPQSNEHRCSSPSEPGRPCCRRELLEMCGLICAPRLNGGGIPQEAPGTEPLTAWMKV